MSPRERSGFAFARSRGSARGMETFDQSLKYLLEHEPADFLRFALGGASVEVIEPVEVTLPSRGRAIDGSYRARIAGAVKVVHVEFQRRHQAQHDVAVDV